MGFFNLFGTRPSLIDAVLKASEAELATLCTERRADIAAAFASWLKVPLAMRSDPAQVSGYVGRMLRVAQLFEQRGDSSLMAKMQGGSSNPIAKWQSELRECRALNDRGDYVSAKPRLEKIRAEARALQGSAVDTLLPLMNEFLAEAEFRLGAPGAASALMAEAVTGFEAIKDGEGTAAALKNLIEIYRVLGDAKAQGACEERLSSVLALKH